MLSRDECCYRVDSLCWSSEEGSRGQSQDKTESGSEDHVRLSTCVILAVIWIECLVLVAGCWMLCNVDPVDETAMMLYHECEVDVSLAGVARMRAIFSWNRISVRVLIYYKTLSEAMRSVM